MITKRDYLEYSFETRRTVSMGYTIKSKLLTHKRNSNVKKIEWNNRFANNEQSKRLLSQILHKKQSFQLYSFHCC